MNERDSEAVAAQLLAKGYTLAASEQAADVILLNTCSVRDMAEQKAFHKMQTLMYESRRRRPGVVLGFLGCMAQSRGQELIDRLPDVDLVVGTQKFHRTAEHLDDILAGRREKVVDLAEEEQSEAAIREHLLYGASGAGSPASGDAPRSPARATAFVSIMQGCNQYCTFCIVPYTRGSERSRTIQDIVEECRELASRGIKEVTLLGQIVTNYGRRQVPVRNGKSAFVQLLEAVHAIDGLERVRFTSPHPKGYGDDLVDAYGRLPKLVDSAHIPVQSGSDRVLRLMHRGYTRERFLEIVSKLRAVRPALGLSTDFIVGFPGETDADFEQTESLVREVGFDQAYVFRYSERKDTPAVCMPSQVPEEVREERHQRLLGLVNSVAAPRYQAFIGRSVQVLVEGPSKRNEQRFTGRTRCNKIVIFAGCPGDVGQMMELQITRAAAFTLYGEPLLTGRGR